MHENSEQVMNAISPGHKHTSVPGMSACDVRKTTQFECSPMQEEPCAVTN
jgi:hypothetical protein